MDSNHLQSQFQWNPDIVKYLKGIKAKFAKRIFIITHFVNKMWTGKGEIRKKNNLHILTFQLKQQLGIDSNNLQNYFRWNPDIVK